MRTKRTPVELERGVDWDDPEEGHFCGSIFKNSNGTYSGSGSITGLVSINGVTYQWSKDVTFGLRRFKPTQGETK